MSNLKNTYFNLDNFVLNKLIKEQEEIEPIGGETKAPNEFAYYDFKSWAYEVGRKELFREKKFKVGNIEYTLEEATEMGAGIMFSVLSQIWTLWTEETDNDQFGRIKDDNVNDFGKALYNMMKKDNFFFSKEERGAKVGMDQQDADYLKQTYGVEMNEKKIGFNRGPEYSEETEDLLNDFAKSTEMISKELEKKVVDSDDPKVQEILNLLDDNLDPEFIEDLETIYELIQELPDKSTEPSKIGFRETVDELYIDKNFKDVVRESLRNWFKKEDWVRIDTQGNITGKCGTMKKGKATTRCLPRAKANRLSKKERAKTARKKARGSRKGKQFVKNTKKAKVKLKKEITMENKDLLKKIKKAIEKTLSKEGGASGLKPLKKAVAKKDKPKGFELDRTLDKMKNVKQHRDGDYILTPLEEIKEGIFEIVTEELCKKGKAYIAKRKRAGEKSSAYLSGRAVKVCKGQMKGEAMDPVGKEDDDINNDGKVDKTDDYLLNRRKAISKNIEEYDVVNEEDIKNFTEFMRENYLNTLEEAEYKGRKVKLGKPMRGDVKKFKVYVKNPKGNVVKVNFGQKGMNIKKNNPKRRKAFRARHNCDNPGPRHKARYWSCRKW